MQDERPTLDEASDASAAASPRDEPGPPGTRVGTSWSAGTSEGSSSGRLPSNSAILAVMVLNRTPPERLVDASGRPYFLWDVDLTLATFRERLRDADIDVRAYLTGKLMRQAKPDDVFAFVSMADIAALWPHLERYLGRSRPFWAWLLGWWKAQAGGGR